ncbi:hypothetical protein J2T02_002626 [Chitinophaga terrae (ex Kim and Jung 2007)]|uniref:hypothetical protein n=1 Tax=Chitinophaga terrae (ex Kim and Jung 2007) TaxID=408074 RepID=UPI00277FEBE9|nr:hypothetical protein [Chitinophaga terrae (ex Kim and Jung 2007)]MDQ0107507.1 hypothetical protein [Chitinophaga terrae (ex Kim and Jung 2007)]
MKSPLFYLAEWFQRQPQIIQMELAARIGAMHDNHFLSSAPDDIMALARLEGCLKSENIPCTKLTGKLLIIISFIDHILGERTDVSYCERLSAGMAELSWRGDLDALGDEQKEALEKGYRRERSLWAKAHKQWCEVKQHHLSREHISNYEQQMLLITIKSRAADPYSVGTEPLKKKARYRTRSYYIVTQEAGKPSLFFVDESCHRT